MKTKTKAYIHNDPHPAERDLIMAIDKLERIDANVNRTYTWVASHQDDEEEQDVDVKSNERADELATDTRDNVITGLQ